MNTLLLAGGGVRGGREIGASDGLGGDPIADTQTPDNLAATMYDALGIRHDAMWTDLDGRPHKLFYSPPIAGLMGC